MEKSKLYKLYEVVLKEVPLNQSSLQSIGMNSQEIHELLEEGVIVSLEDGYKFVDFSSLLFYGLDLNYLRKEKAAYQCITFCKKMDPTLLDAHFYAIWKSVCKRNYNNAFFDVEHLDPSLDKDAKLLKLVLYYILDTPDYSREEITLEDILTDDDTPLMRLVKEYIFTKQFHRAYSNFEDVNKGKKNISFRDRLLKMLLIDCKRIEKMQLYVSDYMRQGLWDVAYLYLASVLEEGRIPLPYFALYHLLHDYMLIRNGIVHIEHTPKGMQFYQVVLNHEHLRARQMINWCDEKFRDFFLPVLDAIIEELDLQKSQQALVRNKPVDEQLQ